MDDERTGEGLIRIGAMRQDEVDEVLRRQRRGDGRLFGQIACELGFVDDEAIRSYLGIKIGCRYQGGCHFRNMSHMNVSTRLLKERYCDEWPEKCAIYHHKVKGEPVAITLWPTGRLQA